MSNTWFAIPSKRPPEEAEKVLKLWRERGYKIAVYRDHTDPELERVHMQVIGVTPYQGYAMAVNSLCWHILLEDPQAEWIVTGGDDVEPDPNHSAEEIASDCSEYFAGCGPAERFDASTVSMSIDQFERSRTFGVMQPTGDRWGENAVPGLQGAYIDRVCGSPWMGREFCRRMYQGNGPLWPEFSHMFEDEHLQCVAQKLGVLWQRRDLTHFHRHWGRNRGVSATDCPEFLRNVNTSAHWAESKAIFERLKAGGFVEANELLP